MLSCKSMHSFIKLNPDKENGPPPKGQFIYFDQDYARASKTDDDCDLLTRVRYYWIRGKWM